MNDVLLAIKLGGGLITDKKKPLTHRPEIIKSLAREISQIRKKGEADIVVGTGAGSYGHYLVAKHGLALRGPLEGNGKTVNEIHEAVKSLNGLVAKEIRAEGLPIESVSGQSVVENPARIEAVLAGGKIASIYGDIVTETDRYKIYSTEELFKLLLNRLALQYNKVLVVLAVAEGGVLDARGNTISTIDKKQIDGLSWSKHEGYDVTGGMEQKLRLATELLDNAQRVQIVDGRVSGNILKALQNRRVGTIVR